MFSPLGLADTTADQNFAIIPHRTEFYDATNGALANAPYVDNSVKWAGGGFQGVRFLLVASSLDLDIDTRKEPLHPNA